MISNRHLDINDRGLAENFESEQYKKYTWMEYELFLQPHILERDLSRLIKVQSIEGLEFYPVSEKRFESYIKVLNKSFDHNNLKYKLNDKLDTYTKVISSLGKSGLNYIKSVENVINVNKPVLLHYGIEHLSAFYLNLHFNFTEENKKLHQISNKLYKHGIDPYEFKNVSIDTTTKELLLSKIRLTKIGLAPRFFLLLDIPFKKFFIEEMTISFIDLMTTFFTRLPLGNPYKLSGEFTLENDDIDLGDTKFMFAFVQDLDLLVLYLLSFIFSYLGRYKIAAYDIFFQENFFSLWIINILLPHGGAFAKHWTESFRYSGMIFPVILPSKNASDTVFNLIRENSIWQKRLNILIDKLKEYSLVFEANHFVSTKGGKLRPYYCISTVLAQEINRIINTTYKECSKLFNKKFSDFEHNYFGLQFFDRLLFQYNGWEVGQIDSVGALELFNDYYIKYYDSIMEYITLFKDNFLIDETVKTKIPSIHIKSPQSFLTYYKEQYSKIMDTMDKIPSTDCKTLDIKEDPEKKAKTAAQPKDKVAPVPITTGKDLKVIGRKSDVRQKGYLGTIENKKLFLDLYHPHVITILGVQGSGKSYTGDCEV